MQTGPQPAHADRPSTCLEKFSFFVFVHLHLLLTGIFIVFLYPTNGFTSGIVSVRFSGDTPHLFTDTHTNAHLLLMAGFLSNQYSAVELHGLRPINPCSVCLCVCVCACPRASCLLSISSPLSQFRNDPLLFPPALIDLCERWMQSEIRCFCWTEY